MRLNRCPRARSLCGHLYQPVERFLIIALVLACVDVDGSPRRGAFGWEVAHGGDRRKILGCGTASGRREADAAVGRMIECHLMLRAGATGAR